MRSPGLSTIGLNIGAGWWLPGVRALLSDPLHRLDDDSCRAAEVAEPTGGGRDGSRAAVSRLDGGVTGGRHRRAAATIHARESNHTPSPVARSARRWRSRSRIRSVEAEFSRSSTSLTDENPRIHASAESTFGP